MSILIWPKAAHARQRDVRQGLYRMLFSLTKSSAENRLAVPNPVTSLTTLCITNETVDDVDSLPIKL